MRAINRHSGQGVACLAVIPALWGAGAVLWLFPVQTSRADAIVVTRAMSASTVMEVFIEEQVVRVELEIGVGDLAGFRNLLPADLLERMGSDPVAPLAERLPRFFAEDLTIRMDDGPALPGQLTSLEGRRTIPVEMQPALLVQVREFVADHLDLTVDGAPVVPEFDRINFLRRTLRTSTVIAPPEALDTASATLGMIFVHPTAGLPREAALTWDLFVDKLPRVRSAATDEAGPLPYVLQPDDNVLTWKNFLKQPTIPTVIEVEAP